MAVKTPKRGFVKYKYKKGTFIQNKEEILSYIKQKNVTIELLESGQYDDGKDFLTIKVDNITSSESVVNG